jgi:predicted GNAT family N-acyltransferase
MTPKVTITFNLATTDAMAELGFEAWINQRKFLDMDHVKETQSVAVELDDEDNTEHELRLVLKNKTGAHTQVDEHGNIVADARLIITDVAFDEIQLGHMFVEQAVYTHDFNGTGKETEDTFYGELGCNGTVSLKFATPMYLWLLEHM